MVKPWQLYFLNDDFMHIPDARLWLRSGFMRPVPNVFLWIDKQLFGNSALGFFATTMLLQVGCVLVVFFTTNKIAARYLHPLPVGNLGFVTALLFMVYPWHAEAMMWVISRVSIMACLFTLASFYFYIDASRRPFLMMPALLFFLLALFSYESMWSAILFFGLFSILNVRRGYASTSQEALSFGVVAMVFAAYLVLRVVVLSTLAGDGYDEINTNLSNFGLLLGNGIKLFGRIFTPPFANSNYFLAVFALVLLVLLAAVAWAYKKNRLVFWALVVALAGMAAGVATAAPLGIDTHYNESERYLYYASYFYCFFCGTVIVLLVGKAVQGWVLFGLMGVFTILLANLQQNYRYASAITRTTMQTVAQYPSYNRAVFIDVPTKYKGSMVFRICLPHGIRWINPMAKYDSILIFNQVKSFERSENFETGVVDWPVLAKAKQWPSERAVLPGSDTLQSHDVVFWFKPEGIYKVNFTAPLPQTRE
ncbi:MAG: hypothetical protein EAY75_06590 [Bacteroidetes bacterium]|nr:MAG: hypothetical protein EAY75_06590 [Bacteroidota bacterium]